MDLTDRSIKDAIEKLKDQIDLNKDYISEAILQQDEYIRRVGVIEGLKGSITILEQVHSDYFGT